MLKGYLFVYSSKNNIFYGKKLITALSLNKAQDSFFEWLKIQEVYSHLWQLSIEIELIEL